MSSTSSYAFNFTSPVVPPLLVGREDELARTEESLVESSVSVLLTGPRKIGKSSLVRTLNDRLCKQASGVLPFSLDMQRFNKVSIGDFLRLLAHQLCVEVWTTVIRRPLSELIAEVVADPRGSTIARKEIRTLHKIFRLLTSEKFSGSQTSSRNLGGKLVVDAGLAESTTLSVGRRSLETFEFLHLLDEILEVTESHNISSIIALCDEANHLPETISADILCRYFEVFASRRMTFCFVAVPLTGSGIEELRSLFPLEISLGPFREVRPIEELLHWGAEHYKQAYGRQLDITRECSERIFQVSGGHPWGAQRLAHEVFTIVSKKSKGSIEVDLVNEAAVGCLDFLSMCR